MICQIKNDGQYRVDQPTFSLHERNGEIYLWSRYNNALPPDTNSTLVAHTHPISGLELLATITKGMWHCFDIITNWDPDPLGDGFIKMYMAKDRWSSSDIDLIVDYDGQFGYNDPRGGYVKLGIYKWDWKDQAKVDASIAAGCTEVVRYYDSVTVANEYLPLNSTGVGVQSLLL